MSNETLVHGDIAVPEAYRPLEVASPFNVLCGPYYQVMEAGEPVGMALQISTKHLNHHMISHGGLLMSLADNAMGQAVYLAYSGKAALVTASLTSEFMEPAREGDWVEARPRVQRTGKSLAFVDCTITVGDRSVFRASAVFAVVQRKP